MQATEKPDYDIDDDDAKEMQITEKPDYEDGDEKNDQTINKQDYENNCKHTHRYLIHSHACMH